MARAFLSRGTPVVALSATLTRRVRRDIQTKLQFSRLGSRYWNDGNDRSNVSIVVRACQNPMNTFTDLDFVIPACVQKPEDIPKTWIYIDDINMGNEIVNYLGDLVEARGHKHGKDRGLVSPFNATLSHEYRHAAMDAFRNGSIRVMVYTDAAGMVSTHHFTLFLMYTYRFNLPGMQRTGCRHCCTVETTGHVLQLRPTSGARRRGLAVLLVEPSVYLMIIDETTSGKKKRRQGKCKGKGSRAEKQRPTASETTAPKKTAAETRAMKTYARLHGAERGGLKKRDAVSQGVETPLNLLADDEGLCAFVQTTQCRRGIWAQIFDNDPDKLRESQQMSLVSRPRRLEAYQSSS